MKIGLYFGTYNPIHIGHMAIANYMVEFTEIQQLWFVVSPHNPFKNKKHLLADYHRLELVNLAIGDDGRFRACDIEFKLPQPSYTIDTLTYLAEKYPMHEFYLVMGSDNLEHLTKWKNYEMIIGQYKLLVYPRPGFCPENALQHPNIRIVEAPLMEVSASFIRHAIADGKNLSHFIPEKVWEYLDKMNFYK